MRKKIFQKRRKYKVSNINSPIISQREQTTRHNDIELIQYNEGEYKQCFISKKDSLTSNWMVEQVNWLRIPSLSNVEFLKDLFKAYDLHSFDIRDIMSDQNVVKVGEYDNISFILIPAFVFKDNSLETVQLAFILGDNFLISMQEFNLPMFEDIKQALKEKNIRLTQKNADFLLYTLLSEVNNLNLNAIIQIENKLLDIEDFLLEGKADELNVVSELREYRIAYIKLKRALLSIREEYRNLQRNTNNLIEKRNEIYFEDLDDKIRTSMGDLETCHELINFVLDLYYSNTNMKMNGVMQRLTLVATIFIPLTFLVGVWGMNFVHMPELEWEYGYLFAWAMFVLVVLFIVYIMRRNRWF